MSEQILRKRIREIIKKYISENQEKQLTREGIMDSILNHVSDVLKKSRDKRFNKTLDKIGKSSPEGKKAVEKTVKYAKMLDDAWDDITAMADAERY